MYVLRTEAVTHIAEHLVTGLLSRPLNATGVLAMEPREAPRVRVSHACDRCR
jgi:hypothetical protein